MRAFIWRDVTVVIICGDLTDEDTDAVVCPANSYGHMQGGVAAAICIRGGDLIEREAQSKAPIRIGQAISTSGGKLKSRRVFHAPTMAEPIEVAQPHNVQFAMRAALRLAFQERIESISFPGMGTGTGALPYSEAARLMLRSVREAIEQPHTLRRIHLVAVSEALFSALISASETEFGKLG